MNDNSQNSRRPRRRWRRRLVCLLVVTIVSVGAWTLRDQLLPAVARWLDVGEKPRPADYAMILPGGEETRPFVAAGLVRRKLVQAVLVPQTVVSPLEQDELVPPNHEIIRRTLVARGVRDEQLILLEGRSGSTWNDAESLARFLHSKPNCTVAIITNDFHTRRARWVMRRILPDRRDDLFFVSAPMDEYGPDDWWKYRMGLAQYLGEYCKFVVYMARYGDLTFWAIVAVAAIMGVVGTRVLGGRR